MYRVLRIRTWVATVFLLSAVGMTIASNMGFKFVHRFTKSDPKVYYISLPLNSKFTVSGATNKTIFDDINAKCSTSGASTSQVAVFDENQVPCTWLGVPGGCVEPITVGKSYWVSVQGAAPRTWIPAHY